MARDTSLYAYVNRVLSGDLKGVSDKVFGCIYQHYSDELVNGKPKGVCPEQVRQMIGGYQNTISTAFSRLEHGDKVIYRVGVWPNITTGLPVGWFAPRTEQQEVSVAKARVGRFYILVHGTPAVLKGPFIDEHDRSLEITDTPSTLLRIKDNCLVVG